MNLPSSHRHTCVDTYDLALQAAQIACAGHDYPRGALYVAATPIGNLADITLRALHLLQIADVICCEDTRHTQSLLQAYGITQPRHLAVHQHNEAESATTVCGLLRQNQRVVYVCDAGTPAISDPGARLVAHVRQAGCPVVPLPGVCSITAALSVAGISHDDQGDFVFMGFLPTRAGARAAAIKAIQNELRTVVLLEAPHRIEALAQTLQALGERMLTIGRELTKQFENIVTVKAHDFVAWLSHDSNRLRGEFVLVLHPAPCPVTLELDLHTLKLLMAELPLKTAVKLAADITGAPRNALYDAALRLAHSATS